LKRPSGDESEDPGRMRDRTVSLVGCGVCGKRNGDGDVPHLFGVFGRPIGSVSVLEAYP
jgi:hypothetical protein